jgi:hypothetical protein
MADADRRASNQIEQFDFRSGINDYNPPYLIGDSAVAKAENLDLRKGIPSKRKGYTNYLDNPTATSSARAHAYNGLFRAYGGSNGNQTVSVHDDGASYYIDGSLNPQILMSGPNQPEGNPCFAEWKGTLYMVGESTNADANFFTWDLNPSNPGNTETGAGNRPANACRHINLWRQANRLVACNTEADGAKQTVYLSELGEPGTWRATDFLNVPEDMSGDKVIATANMPGGELLILGERTLSLLYGRIQSDFYLRTVSWKNGCKSIFSVVETDLGVFYKGQNGFFIYDGAANPERVSRSIEGELFDDITDEGLVAELVDDDRIFMSYTSVADGTRKTLCYKLPESGLEGGAWYGPWTYGFNAITYWNGPGDTGEIMAGSDAIDAQIRQLEQGYDDNGTGYGIDLITREHYVQLDPREEILEMFVTSETSEGTSLRTRVKVNGRVWEDTDRPVILSTQGAYEGDRDRTVVTRSRVDSPLILESLNRRAARTVQLRFTSTKNDVALDLRGYLVRTKKRDA